MLLLPPTNLIKQTPDTAASFAFQLRPLLLLRTLIIHNAAVRDLWFVLKMVCGQDQDGRTPEDSHRREALHL
jgi:hypothetical protein